MPISRRPATPAANTAAVKRHADKLKDRGGRIINKIKLAPGPAAVLKELESEHGSVTAAISELLLAEGLRRKGGKK